MTTDYTRFLILGEGRTGSNLLVQALNSHPEIVCFREVFNWTHKRIDYQVAGYEEFATRDRGMRKEQPLQLLRERIFRDWPPPTLAVGFKLHYGHAFGYEGLEEALVADQDLRLIHLRRKNMLRTYVSLMLAQRSGEWEKDDSPTPRVRLRRLISSAKNALGGTDPLTRIHVSPAEFERFVVVHTLQGERYDGLFTTHAQLRLTYEDMVGNFEKAVGEAQDFLCVSHRKPETTLQKQRTRPLADQITNFRELRTHFVGTQHEAWFDD